MFRKAFPLTIAVLLVATCPLQATGQAAPPQFVAICASQLNLPTIYVSGVLQGPVSSAASVRAAFTQFLAQRYGYKGGIGCAAAANAAAAEKMIQDRASALRNAKKNVIETGWAESAAPVAKLARMLNGLQSTAPQGAGAAAAATPTARSASTSTGTAGSRTAAGTTSTAAGGASGSSGSSELAGVLASVFGGGTSGCAGGAAAKSQSGAAGSSSGSSGSASASGTSGSSGSNGSGGCQSALTQVSSALSSAFAQKPTSAGGSAGSQPAHSAADGLGSAQAQNTRLVVYGCGRQDTQVACVTDLTNQNQADTLVQSADLWKDAFIVDDRGDRHTRSRGFFINIDGDQRTQLDVSYGKSARFILMFDDVQSKVQKVSLRSKSGGLDVEDIMLITSGTASSGTASDGSH